MSSREIMNAQGFGKDPKKEKFNTKNKNLVKKLYQKTYY